MHGSRTPMRQYTAKDEYRELHGILKRKKYPDDI